MTAVVAYFKVPERALSSTAGQQMGHCVVKGTQVRKLPPPQTTDYVLPYCIATPTVTCFDLRHCALVIVCYAILYLYQWFYHFNVCHDSYNCENKPDKEIQYCQAKMNHENTNIPWWRHYYTRRNTIDWWTAVRCKRLSVMTVNVWRPPHSQAPGTEQSRLQLPRPNLCTTDTTGWRYMTPPSAINTDKTHTTIHSAVST